MNIDKVSVPEVYKESWDFRFFLKWFKTSLSKVQHDTENMSDLYDPLRCPDWLLWMLGDTVGFRYDDRLPAAFNRLVILYFMSMIRNKGSKDGVTLAAEVNLAQFNLLEYGKSSDILYNRLEDTSIPVNSAYVNPHTAEGYIDVVYFSQQLPIDACIEYVRPLGMYCFKYAGVRFDARTKISVDPRLTNIEDIGVSIGATHVGHYRREDYARVQRVTDTTSDIRWDVSVLDQVEADPRIDYIKPPEGSGISKRQYYQEQRAKLQLDKRIKHERAQIDEYYPGNGTYYRNPDYEGEPSDEVYAGLRSLYSLQLCNNEHVMKSLIPGLDPDELEKQYKIFGIGYTPQTDNTTFADDYVLPDEEYDPTTPYLLDWSSWSNATYPTGFRLGYFGLDGSVNSNSVRWLRSRTIFTGAFSNYTHMIVTPPDGYIVRVTEYSGSTASTSNFVQYYGGSLATVSDYSGKPIYVPITRGHYYGVTIGAFDSDAADHNTLEFINKFTLIRYISTNKNWNLRYDKTKDYAIGPNVLAPDVYVNDENRTHGVMNPRPAVNPVMMSIGDAISMDDTYLSNIEDRTNQIYTKVEDDEVHIEIPE